MHAIHIRGLSKQFGSAKILSNLDLIVRKGEFLSILGPSGCGKSTLLRVIAGLEEPTTGRVEIAGRDVTRVPTWKRHIGFVFQNFALWPHLSVLRNVSMGLELLSLPAQECRTRAIEALRLVKLEDFADRMPTQLSGGQQQRVAIARAVVLKPDVLLMDEPLSALDKRLRQEMQVELKSLQHELQLTTIFVTHDQEEAMSLSDRVVVMNRGVIEQLGTPQEIYNSPTSAYVASFVGETTFFEGATNMTGEEAWLTCKNGLRIPLQSAAPQDSRPQAAFVRPEWIQVQKYSSDFTGVEGVVERTMFYGSTLDLLVRHGEQLIRVSTPAAVQAFSEGERVQLNFAARLLPPSISP